MTLPSKPSNVLPAAVSTYFTNIDDTAADHEARIQVVEGGEAGDVQSVNTVEPVDGDVTLTAGDVPVTPAGAIAATDVQAALVELDSEKAPVNDPLGWGRVVTFCGESINATAQTVQLADRGIYLRCVTGGTISKVAFHSAVSSGNVSVAVYADDGTAGAPGTRKETSGAVAMPTAGYSEIALGGSVAVAPGDYLFLSCDNITATFYSASNVALASALYAGRAYYQNSAHPGPASATPSAGLIRGPILVGVA